MSLTDDKSPLVTPRSLRSTLVRIPPPPAFVLPLVFGLLLGRRAPLPIVPESLHGAARALAAVLLVVGVGFTAACVAQFARRRTTIVPHRRASTLVTTGPYRVSRNPMYVGLTAIYLGVAAFANVLWPLLLLPLPLLLVALVHIPVEERLCVEVFGDTYREYASRVRRWL